MRREREVGDLETGGSGFSAGTKAAVTSRYANRWKQMKFDSIVTSSCGGGVRREWKPAELPPPTSATARSGTNNSEPMSHSFPLVGCGLSS